MESTQGGHTIFPVERTGSSNMNGQRGNTTDKSRRVWSEKEEELLVAAMKEIIAKGNKSDNGFKGGYLNKVELIFKNQLPGTDLCGNPHINSKLTMWKKDYYALSSILSQSGVGFNLFGTFTVDCDEPLWDSIKLTVKNANKIRAKKWPFYYDWKEIFGKDRATGEGGENITDAINELEGEYPTLDEDNTQGDYHVNLDHIHIPDDGGDSLSQSQLPSQQPEHVMQSKGKKSRPNTADNSTGQSQQPEGSKSKAKKRKASLEGIEKVCTLLTEINRTNSARWETMATHISYDYELGQARMGIFAQLGNISGLSNIDRFTVCEILGSKKEKLETFLSLPEGARPEYVEHLLKSI